MSDLNSPIASPVSIKPVAGALAAVLATVALPCQAAEFPGFTDEQLEATQYELARAYTQGNLADDPVVEAYLNEMARQLAPEIRAYVSVEKELSVNAYAAGGNIIVFWLGMLDFLDTENELTGVMAHELAHLKLNHLARLPDNLSGYNVLSTAALVIALLGGGDALPIAATTSGLARNKALELSRRYEREADQAGLRYLLAAGQSTDGFIDTLARLQSAAGVPEYLLTHPVSQDRIGELRSSLRSRTGAESTLDRSELDFWLIQEKARALTPSRRATKAGDELRPYVLAYRQLVRNEGDLDKLVAELEPVAGNWIVAAAVIERALQLSRLDIAGETLDQALAVAPERIALRALQLRLHAARKDRAAATRALASLPSRLRNSRHIAEAEARVWAVLDEPFRHRLALGYHHYMAGDIGGAKLQIEQARQLLQTDEVSAEAGRLQILEKKVASLESLGE